MKKLLAITLLTLVTFIHGLAQSASYAIYALRYAKTGHSLPLKYLVLNAPDTATMNAVFMFWLIKGDNDKNVLVDAGFLPDVEEAKDYDLINYTRPDSMLLKMGIKPSEITDIILSHPHWDHMDGVDLFPNARVWIQKEDFNFVVGTAWQKGGGGGFNKRDVRKLIEVNLDGRLTLVDGDNKEIIPGITVYTGSRHTFNSQYALVKTGQDKIILASDNVYTYYNLDSLKSAPENATFDTTGYVNAMKRMKTLASNINFIIPGHDALLFLKFPEVKPGIIKIK
jgi:Zn-dependent hydrolases, including glyoxylases